MQMPRLGNLDRAPRCGTPARGMGYGVGEGKGGKERKEEKGGGQDKKKLGVG
jgi:hypothetical protein